MITFRVDLDTLSLYKAGDRNRLRASKDAKRTGADPGTVVSRRSLLTVENRARRDTALRGKISSRSRTAGPPTDSARSLQVFAVSSLTLMGSAGCSARMSGSRESGFGALSQNPAVSVGGGCRARRFRRAGRGVRSRAERSSQLPAEVGGVSSGGQAEPGSRFWRAVKRRDATRRVSRGKPPPLYRASGS